jgi:hypothetical protein
MKKLKIELEKEKEVVLYFPTIDEILAVDAAVSKNLKLYAEAILLIGIEETRQEAVNLPCIYLGDL